MDVSISTGITIESFLASLDNGLTPHESPRTRAWWEKYLKGEAAFRGVKMADIRRVVNELVAELHLSDADIDDLLAIAMACFARPASEEKLAGVLLLAEHARGDLTLDHVAALGEPLSDGSIADWNVCDWYCVKVLGPFVTDIPDEIPIRSKAIAEWRSSDALWRKRAAAVAFVNHAATDPELFAGFTTLLIEVCSTNVQDETRWSQTSVGWLLRELSARDPDLVKEFVAQHPAMSTEARRNATKKLE